MQSTPGLLSSRTVPTGLGFAILSVVALLYAFYAVACASDPGLDEESAASTSSGHTDSRAEAPPSDATAPPTEPGTQPSGSALPPSESPTTATPEGIWLRGDFHLHSDHSTDALDNPMSIIRPLAEELGMDFFVVTDHDNHVNGDLTTWDDPDYRSDSMTILYGVEMTMPGGHANLFSEEPWDHLALWALREIEDQSDLMEEIRRMGLHFSINHPTSPDSWRRGFDVEMDSLEVWNAVYAGPSNNSGALELWDEFLLDGRRIPARGGSDCHHQEGYQARLFNVGSPTTWVYADDRSGASILRALNQGRATMSYAPAAERIELHADADGDGGYELMMGDVLPEATGEPITLRVRIVDARPDETYRVRIIRNGERFEQREVTVVDGEAVWILEDTPPIGERTYYRAEVYASTLPLTPDYVLSSLYRDAVGFTNPIYVGF